MKTQPILTLVAVVLAGSAGRTQGLPLPAPVTDRDFHDNGKPAPAKVELGRMLFFDKILGGNKNIACATCHHPRHATSDGLALGFGEGASGLGPKRHPGTTLATAVSERVPRNATALWNLGAREYTRMFHDGRVEVDDHGFYESGFITPARWKLPKGLDNVLAAQAMFPVSSPTEMAGQQGENEIADARSLNNVGGHDGAWERLAKRLQAIPEYVELFRRAYPGKIERASDITFVDAANAIAAFEATEFRADKSPFDRYLRGDHHSLTAEQEAGMRLFYGRARCARCHSGKFQTDHEFHAIAMPQIGPGKKDGRDASFWSKTGVQEFVEDHGRARVTAHAKDLYAFRTPSLRNVELTGPWGHDGAYTSLAAVVHHHANPTAALHRYRLPAGLLPEMGRVVELTGNDDELHHTWMSPSRARGFALRDGWVQSQAGLRNRIAKANELAPQSLSETEIGQLTAFLYSLTDPLSRDLEARIPRRVPSGLPVED